MTGQYDSVIKANSYLEQYVLDKLNSEVSAKLITTAATTSSLNTGKMGDYVKYGKNFRVIPVLTENLI